MLSCTGFLPQYADMQPDHHPGLPRSPVRQAEYAVKMAEEGKIPSDVTDTMSDGSYDIPAKVLEPVAVTRDNIDEVIIDGGFHRRDEVYLNIDYDTE